VKLSTYIGQVTEWARIELCDCLGGVDLDVYGSFYLDEDGSGHAEDVTVNGPSASVHGTIDVFPENARRIAMAIRIDLAESAADLLEGLADEDEDIRELACGKLDDLGLNGDPEKLGEKV